MKVKFAFGVQLGSWWSWSRVIGTDPTHQLFGFSITDALLYILTISCPLTLELKIGW
jgi:hypothetical protein